MIVPAESSHLAAITPQYAQTGELLDEPGAAAEVLEGFSLVDEGNVLGVFLISKLWEGVYEIAMLLSESAVAQHRIRVGFVAYKLFHRHVQRKYHPRRVQTTVRCGFSDAEHLVERLGFENEGTLTAYGPGGEDYGMWAWLAEQVKGVRCKDTRGVVS